MREKILHIPLVGKYHGIRLTFGWGITGVFGFGLSLDANPEYKYYPRLSVAMSLLFHWFELEII